MSGFIEEVWLRSQLGARKSTNCSWMCILVSHISSKKLHTLSLVFDNSREPHDITLSQVLDVFESKQYSLIDDLLSTAQFSSLRKVRFQIHAHAEYAMPDEQQWHRALSSRLPNLCARGILGAHVDIPHYWY